MDVSNDQLNALLKISDNLQMSIFDLTRKEFDLIEKLLLLELKKMRGKKITGAELYDFLIRSQSWGDIQAKVFNNPNSLLNQSFVKYQKEIQILEKTYGEKFNSINLENYREQMRSVLNKALNINTLISKTEYQTNLLNASNEILLFSNQTDFLINAVAKEFHSSLAQAKTILVTSQKMVFSAIRQEYYQNLNIPEAVYMYMGPDDLITRPFCSEHIGQIKTEAQWINTLNDDGQSAWYMQGGYNCRHQQIMVFPENFDRSENLDGDLNG